MKKVCLAVSCFALFGAQALAQVQQAAPATAPRETQIAPGLTYRHIRSTTPAGEPWSIHVLEASRTQKSLALRAIVGHGEGDEMQRELPTLLGARAAAAGDNVLAVVNGDYDLAAPYLGISDGLAIEGRRLWTTGKPTWPAMAVLHSGEPVIAVPQVELELRAGERTWRIGALNKPLGSAHGPEPRLYSRGYRSAVKSETPFRAVVISRLSPRLPLRVDTDVQGFVTQVFERANEVPIPSDALVLAERLPRAADAQTTDKSLFSDLRTGERVKLHIRVRMEGKAGVQDVIGGFPFLVQDSHRSIVGEPSEYLSRRHPRTAACYNQNKIIFVVVDGRQPQLSVGMTLEELADLMVSLGCTVAFNTDGGGSSVMAISAPQVASGTPPTTSTTKNPDVGALLAAPSVSSLQIVNSPSDGKERGRGNAWLIVGKR